jgi:hypothetical protein
LTVVVILFFIGLIFAAALWGYHPKIKKNHKKRTLLAITWQEGRGASNVERRGGHP